MDTQSWQKSIVRYVKTSQSSGYQKGKTQYYQHSRKRTLSTSWRHSTSAQEQEQHRLCTPCQKHQQTNQRPKRSFNTYHHTPCKDAGVSIRGDIPWAYSVSLLVYYRFLGEWVAIVHSASLHTAVVDLWFPWFFTVGRRWIGLRFFVHFHDHLV